MASENLKTDGNRSIGTVEIYALLIFIGCILVGIFIPLGSAPLMVFLLIYGMINRRSEKNSVAWRLSRSALASAIVLAVISIVFNLFFRMVYIK
ncbi:hypothetical protein LARV_00512 [Longilinea arvoryzae]|uniref:Uncharacterized protein n=1 Tax=Longilinea arvoryzae TaxID=360412 RepID=A0A0S7BFD5_9CHLR|nr:hypothetical protein [Longilinea arvoryzae]GAP12776.1 hypothetical protein LARV_00512 [Longilinea arvoryzae]